jgi:hypothetical protein
VVGQGRIDTLTAKPAIRCDDQMIAKKRGGAASGTYRSRSAVTRRRSFTETLQQRSATDWLCGTSAASDGGVWPARMLSRSPQSVVSYARDTELL